MSSVGLVREWSATTPDTIRSVRRAVADYAHRLGVAGEKLDAVVLAVSEAATNVVVHAYPDHIGPLHLSAMVSGGELCVRIVDDGVGCNAGSRNPGLGLGLGLIADSCDHFTLVQRRPRGTTATLRFQLAD
ncbi:MAG TPA: ATP-binding protein [Solirubrobacteraceae bacterium]|jgi:anti-sigma regulatory factor (Ser/Thr protein kinase)|nr:ATP-binding protein [Solirubrobacteraceae bacterium]